ncbi:MAG: hypothetical protein RLY75_1053 [Pseudomonadota bacterium]
MPHKENLPKIKRFPWRCYKGQRFEKGVEFEMTYPASIAKISSQEIREAIY